MSASLVELRRIKGVEKKRYHAPRKSATRVSDIDCLPRTLTNEVQILEAETAETSSSTTDVGNIMNDPDFIITDSIAKATW